MQSETRNVNRGGTRNAGTGRVPVVYINTVIVNPIIKAIQSHIDNGDKPVNFLTILPTNEEPTAIGVILANGREIRHDVNPKDHRQFVEWFKEAEQWWNTVTDTRKRR